jgi:hypothetical protein
MPTIEIQLTDDAYAKLETFASSERRLPDAQAEVLVLMGLGLWPQKAPAKVAAKSSATSAKRAVPVPSSFDGNVTHSLQDKY